MMISMRSTSRAALACTLALAITCAPALAGTADHRRTVTGTIAAVDKDANTVTVDVGLGKQVVVRLTDETKVSGGEIEAGKDVRISTTSRGGLRYATSVKVRS